jgi:hypothetical protein
MQDCSRQGVSLSLQISMLRGACGLLLEMLLLGASNLF